MNTCWFSLTLASAVVTLCRPALAESPADDAGEYQLHLALDAALLVSPFVLGVGSLVLGSEATLSMDELDSLERNDVPPFDRFAIDHSSETAAALSDVLEYVALAAPFTLVVAAPKQWREIAVISLEVHLWALAGIALSKNFITRTRPFAYDASRPASERSEATDSFVSGHAAQIAAGAMSFAAIYSDLARSSHARLAVWGAALAVVAVGAGLRVGAGVHFPTDVAAGALWGGACGILIPRVHRRRRAIGIRPRLSSDGAGLSLIGRF